MNEDVYRQVAALHVRCIDRGFLATLGVPFLALMYRAIDEASDSVLLIDAREGQVMGFVSGGMGMGTIYRRMLHRPLRLGRALLPVLFRPATLAGIIEILRYGRSRPVSAGARDAELLSLAVAPEARGKGMAEGLYTRLQGHYRACGVPRFRITVGDALLPAHRFYTRMGAMPIGRVEVHPGDASTVYVQACGSDGAQAVPGSAGIPAIT